MESIKVGTHATAYKHRKEGMLSAIPATGYFAIDMMVKLTLNICPELALFNGARGTVRPI